MRKLNGHKSLKCQKNVRHFDFMLWKYIHILLAKVKGRKHQTHHENMDTGMDKRILQKGRFMNATQIVTAAVENL